MYVTVDERLIVECDPWTIRPDTEGDTWNGPIISDYDDCLGQRLTSKPARFYATPSRGRYAWLGLEFEMLDPGLAFEDARKMGLYSMELPGESLET